MKQFFTVFCFSLLCLLGCEKDKTSESKADSVSETVDGGSVLSDITPSDDVTATVSTDVTSSVAEDVSTTAGDASPSSPDTGK